MNTIESKTHAQRCIENVTASSPIRANVKADESNFEIEQPTKKI